MLRFLPARWYHPLALQIINRWLNLLLRNRHLNFSSISTAKSQFSANGKVLTTHQISYFALRDYNDPNEILVSWITDIRLENRSVNAKFALVPEGFDIHTFAFHQLNPGKYEQWEIESLESQLEEVREYSRKTLFAFFNRIQGEVDSLMIVNTRPRR